MSMRSSSEPMAVDASRGARRAASAASSRPSSAEAEGTRRAPLRRRVLSSPCTSGVTATRGARLGRPVGSPRRARRAFTGPRHAIRAGGSRCACVAMVRRARAFHVCVSLADSRSKTFSFADDSGKQHPRQKNPAKRRGRVGKSAVVGAVTRGCRAMTAMVRSVTRRHLDRPSVSVVQVHGMTITRAPTARPRTKIYHAGTGKSQSRFSRDTSAAVDGKLARIACGA